MVAEPCTARTLDVVSGIDEIQCQLVSDGDQRERAEENGWRQAEDLGQEQPQHYAFLVSETEFDQIFARIEERRLPYWADPHQKKRDRINHWDDGRGVYFEDPNRHLLEILTRPYGSAGTSAQNPHPLVAEKLEPGEKGGPAGSAGAAPAAGSGLICAEQPSDRR